MTRGASLLNFTILIAIFHFGSCLQCYKCVSSQSQNCKDPFSSSDMVDCVTQDLVNFNNAYLRNKVLPEKMVDDKFGSQMCAKIVTVNGETIRTCLNGNKADPDQTCRQYLEEQKKNPQTAKTQFKYCSYCDTELCNGSNALMAPLPIALLAVLASYIFGRLL